LPLLEIQNTDACRVALPHVSVKGNGKVRVLKLWQLLIVEVINLDGIINQPKAQIKRLGWTLKEQVTFNPMNDQYRLDKHILFLRFIQKFRR